MAEEVKTIAERMEKLTEKEKSIQKTGVNSFEAFLDRVRIITDVTWEDDGWLARCEIADSGGNILATGHIFRAPDAETSKGEACGTAETRAISKAIAVLLREFRLHTFEDLQEVIEKKTREFKNMVKEGASNRKLAAFVHGCHDDHVKRSMQHILDNHLAQLAENKAKNGATNIQGK